MSVTDSVKLSVVISPEFPVCCPMSPILSKILYKVTALKYPSYGPYSFRIMSSESYLKNLLINIAYKVINLTVFIRPVFIFSAKVLSMNVFTYLLDH